MNKNIVIGGILIAAFAVVCYSVFGNKAEAQTVETNDLRIRNNTLIIGSIQSNINEVEEELSDLETGFIEAIESIDLNSDNIVAVTEDLENTNSLVMGNSEAISDNAEDIESIVADVTEISDGISEDVNAFSRQVSTMDSRIRSVNLRVASNSRKIDRNYGLIGRNSEGVSMAMALASMPAGDPSKRFAISMGTAYFRNKPTISLGAHINVIPNTRILIGAMKSEKEHGIASGITYSFF